MGMIIVTDNNRDDIVRAYAHRLLDDMDFDTLYSFAYDMLIDSKDILTNEVLEDEIKDYCPDLLADDVNPV
jgi:hypothetical protein